jgi:hypothetical protein
LGQLIAILGAEVGHGAIFGLAPRRDRRHGTRVRKPAGTPRESGVHRAPAADARLFGVC